MFSLFLIISIVAIPTLYFTEAMLVEVLTESEDFVDGIVYLDLDDEIEWVDVNCDL